jgi:hypothetical protein
MSDFDAGTFSDLAGTEMGAALWQYLNSPAVVACLETTTYLGRPALEGLQPHLITRFGDEIRPDRWKQLAGRMVRQVMEHRGYVLDQTGVRTRVGDLFTSAARYRKYVQAG